MEAATSLRSRLRPGTPGAYTAGVAEEAWGNTTGTVGHVIGEAGEIAAFTGGLLVALPKTWRYSAEILRQAGIIIVGSALVIFFMEFLVGLMCATEADYVLRGYGATAYTGVFTAWCGVRELAPSMFGYIVAAKIGCGLVAEIGSMKINDEIDAMATMGISPVSYIAATRLIAAWLTFPVIFIIGLGFHIMADYFVIVVQIHEVSLGGWELLQWSVLHPIDILEAEIKIMVSGTLIVVVGMYYGFRAKGGPAGVGTATARSMILNLVLVNISGAVLTTLFWGTTPNAPLGG
jgi:phospholipid/cholesterol/gamma-HCH transport system permease protein